PETAQALALAPAGFPVVVAKTWSLSFEKLRKSSPAAIRMLQLCAFFSPDPISTKMIYSDEMARLLSSYDSTLREKQMVGKVVQELNRFALAKVNYADNTMQVHRLVQAVVSAQMTAGDREQACHDVHRILTWAKPPQEGTDMPTDNPANWPMFDQILPHIAPSRAAECEEEEPRQLLTDLVRYLWKRGEFIRALEMGRSLAARWEVTLGPDDAQLLYLRSQTNNALRSLGQFEDAYTNDQEVYDQQCALAEIGPEHSHTLMTAAGLGADLIGLGRFQEALELNLQTYNKQKANFGDDYPLTLSAANNLAFSYRLIGRCYDALDIDRETLVRRRSVLGSSHPQTLSSAENLGRDLRDAGHYEESVEELRRTHRTYSEVLAPDANETLRTAKSLAVSVRKLGQYQEAKALMLDTFRGYKTHFPSSPDKPSTELALANCYASLGDDQSAMRMAKAIHEGQSRDLGAEHPFTLSTAANLVAFQRSIGDFNGALRLGEETLDALGRRLGETHPYTLACSINVANCRADLGHLSEAMFLERSTLESFQAVLSAEHPDTLSCQANLSITLRQLGQVAESDELRNRTTSLLEQVLGKDHPLVADAAARRRIDGETEFQPL
ncbi:MAG: FxSxx-COOH system tetratricopeptide repeat protein, partial [Streptosporangiaceae bacterium]